MPGYVTTVRWSATREIEVNVNRENNWENEIHDGRIQVRQIQDKWIQEKQMHTRRMHERQIDE